MISHDQHPLSAVFPAMSDAEFAELREDVAANGLNFPIVLFEEMVLDGWHRQRACGETGTEPKYKLFKGDFAKAQKFVISANLKRRHLDTSQRSMIAGRMANMPAHRPGKSVNLPTSTASTADMLNVSTKSVTDARAVLASGDEELIAKVDRGEVAVSKAAKEARGSRSNHSAVVVSAFKIAPRTITEWNAMSTVEQRALLSHRDPKASLNEQKRGEDDNAIDWARWTWNPITGCLHDCPYCYARDIAERFSGTAAFPNGFAPTLMADRLAAPLNRSPRKSDDPRDARIFTGSMSDIYGRWVPEEWINTILGIAREARVWEFLMLTKFPKRMAEFDIPENVWMGTSVDCQARVAAAEAAFKNVKAKVRWLSCEPMIEPLKFSHLDRFNLLVIGGASPSSKTPQWIPPYRWLDDLQRQADDVGCAVFMKSNLYRKESPLSRARYKFADRAPDIFHYLGKRSSQDQQAEAA